MMCDHRLWDNMAEDLSRHATLSFGDLSRGATITEMATQVLAQAPAAFVLCGFSMGGYVAQEIVRLAPERVISLVLINTSATGTTPSERNNRHETAQLMANRSFKGVTTGNLRRSVHVSRAQDQHLLDHIQRMALDLGKDVFLRQLIMVRDDRHNGLESINCPTLVIAARDDRMRSVNESQALADGISGARLIVFENCGHMTPLEQPDALNNVLMDWLNACPTTVSPL
jgi:pimeloyl-ACP methyl ester carboxylesterase